MADVTPLAKLEKLEVLVLKNTQVKDVSFALEDFRIRWYAAVCISGERLCETGLPKRAKIAGEGFFIWIAGPVRS